ncbi:MAG TPA: FmdB family zinc ribbon protein [Polyangia bacterium]|jgi:putative FmdB family regulatory protein
MPIYDYVCNHCGEKFTLTISVSEHERRKPELRCPKCSAAEVEQLYEPFFAVTSRKAS